MKLKNIKSYVYGVLFLLLASCNEKIEMDQLPYERKLVVEALVSTESNNTYVLLTTTQPYSSTSAAPLVTNANVELTDSNTQQKIAFNYDVNAEKFLPVIPFSGDTSHRYYLKIIWEGKTYTASSFLYPMFEVDSALSQRYVQAQFPFPPAGYTVSYHYFDARPATRYTLFTYSFSGIKTAYQDSLLGNVIFDNSATVRNYKASFEIPLLRLDTGNSVKMTFQSIDEEMNRYFAALLQQSRPAPGPFKVPPANLPTNLTNGAIGYFMATDVLRRQKKIVL